MKTGRNDPCPCGSGRKYKNCCMASDRPASPGWRPSFLAGADPAGRGPAGATAPEWEVDAVPLASSIAEDPLARPAAVVVAAGGLVLHADVVGRAPAAPDEVAGLLERGIAAAARRAGGYPEAVVVRHAELLEPLDGLLAPRGIAVQASRELPAIDDFLREGGERLGVGPGGLALSLPTTWAAWGLPEPVVADLFRAAAAYWRAAPWRRVENLDVLHLEFPDGEEALACVLGNAGEEFGLALYAGLADFVAHVTVRDPAGGFLALEGPMLSLTFESRRDLPRPMQKEIAANGWEVAEPDAYPALIVINTPAGGVTRARADRMIAALRAIPAFVERHAGAFGGALPADASIEWRDPETRVRLAYRGPVFDPLGMTLREPLETLAPGLPEGPGADPAAALEPPDDPDRLREGEREFVARFAAWLRDKGVSEATVDRHASNVETFVDYLSWFEGIPVRAVTEHDLRTFLYDWYPRKVHDTRTRSLAVPTSLRRFFAYLAEREGIVCPWADPVLRDRDAFEERLDTFPGGFWWDPGVGDWRAEAYADLDAHVLLHDGALADGVEWGATMGPDEAGLLREVQRRWILWRDDVIRAGTTAPDAVHAELVRRQRAWATAPNPALGGKTPVQAVKKERRKRG